MANPAQDAVNAIELIDARFMKPIAALSKALTEIGSLEQASSEAKTKLADVKSELALESGRLDAIKANAAEVSTEADAIRASAQAEAQQVLTDAHKQADGFVAAARALIAEERTKATKEGDAKLNAVNAKFDEVQKRQFASTKTVADLDDAIVAKRNELSDLQGKIDNARAQIAQMLK